ncbi:MAG: hypothetical protein A2X86_00690 [Bdellovibrionales bacterium GWA2_49_15]|nr:MAG: hypothetical protein A2X86_00690 [Bdellovibrionales bacterium GWA2_49_15]HAZ13218.1 hypothetical protein [Bdellovibrionales bacterium]
MQQDPPHYSLDFLKHPERNFKDEMVDYIKSCYGQLLDNDDLALLASGHPDALSLLSNKLRSARGQERPTLS